MYYEKYDEHQMKLGCIGQQFYDDTLSLINNLRGKNYDEAEKDAHHLKSNIDEICLILSYALRD